MHDVGTDDVLGGKRVREQHGEREERPASDRGEADDEPPTTPIETAMTRSRVLSRPRVEAVPLRCVSALTTNATAPKSSVYPSTWPCTESTLSPYRWVKYVATQTPTSDAGALPRSIHAARRARTVPSRLCRTAPNDLKMAPWRMSVPIAVDGLKLKKKMRIGVIGEPPPLRSSRRGGR